RRRRAHSHRAGRDLWSRQRQRGGAGRRGRMNVVSARDAATRARLRRTGWSAPEAVVATVARILSDVRDRGDAAVIECARRYDDPGGHPAEMRVEIPSAAAAREAIPEAVARAIDVAKERIE